MSTTTNTEGSRGLRKPLDVPLDRLAVGRMVSEQDELKDTQLHGLRRWGTVLGVYLGLFLAMLEISIVSTALVQISDDLQISGQSTWIIVSYLVTYAGFLIIWVQFSEVLGRKPFAIAAMVIFLGSSAGCASAQTSTQLIVLRAFQGLGGSGIYNMAVVIVTEAVRQDEIPKFVSLGAVFTAFAFALGPLVGGAITSRASWSLPFGCLSLLAIVISIPNGFPYHEGRSRSGKTPKLNFGQIDLIGAFLFLSFSTCLVTALQEGNVSYSWDSSLIVDLLVLSEIFMIMFVFWERFVSLRIAFVTPVLSWAFAERRTMGLFMSSFLVGAPFTCTVIQISQRYQILNGLDAVDAGVRLLAYIIMTPVGTVVGTALSDKAKLRPSITLFLGTAFQLGGAIGFALLPFSTSIPSYQYSLQILLGLGTGMNVSVTMSSIPFVVGKAHISSAVGANTQFRSLGGAIGLGIITAIFNAYARPQLALKLPPEEVNSILESTQAIAGLEASDTTQILEIFYSGFSLQWKVVLAFIGAQVPAAILTW